MDLDIDYTLERKQHELTKDTRSYGKRLASRVRDPEAAAIPLFACGVVALIFPVFAEFAFLVALGFFIWVRNVHKKAGLPLQMPKSSGEMDPGDPTPGTKAPRQAAGIMYLGNEQKTNEEVWLTNDYARRHMLLFGTTGSGKTEALMSFVFNNLVQGSGFIFVDGKADSKLYTHIYGMARMMGREDDVLVINFQTGGKDIFGPQAKKRSNTMNPFATGSSGMLMELLKGLMEVGDKKDMWSERALSFVEALIKPLVFLRDNYGLELSISVIRDFLPLDALHDLAFESQNKFPGLYNSTSSVDSKMLGIKAGAAPIAELQELLSKLEDGSVFDGMHAYFKNLPGYKKAQRHDQADETLQQHGYITMQLMRSFNSLADTYGHIMKTPLGEIDFDDVFFNRRIVIVLLPGIEKAPAELANLGRIVVASLKATLAKGLGSEIEGEYADIHDSKPTNSPTVFSAVLDEYGYYAVPGFAIVAAQARGLGVSTIFAGQDYPAFEKASKEEAKSILGNTVTKLCGRLECTDTFYLFQKLAGKGLFSRQSAFDTKQKLFGSPKYDADKRIVFEHVDRLSIDAIKGQSEGEWHMLFGDKLKRINSFYAQPPKIRLSRVNRFLMVSRPSYDEIRAFNQSNEKFLAALMSSGGVKGAIGRPRVSTPQGLIEIADGFDLFKADAPLLRTVKTLARCVAEENRRANPFAMGGGAAEFDAGGDDEPYEPTKDFNFMGAISGMVPEQAQVAGDDDQVVGAAQATASPGVAESTPQGAESVAAVGDELPPESYDAGAIPADDDDLVHSVPSTAFGGRRGEVAYDANDTYAAEQRSPERTEIFDDGARVAQCQQMSVYGVDELPAYLDNVKDDGAGDDPSVAGAPVDFGDEVASGTLEADFTPPSSEEGLLERGITESGLADIERMTGATPAEAQEAAQSVSERLADATRYPMREPTEKPSMQKFEQLARRLSRQLSQFADAEED